jgi:hypothetical protein
MRIHQQCSNLTETMPCKVFFDQDKIQTSFFRIFTSLLKNYKSFLKLRATNGEAVELNSTTDIFRLYGFLGDFDLERRTFMKQICESQAFAQFILYRYERPANDYEVLFFDESVKTKLNRSKFKFSKEDTPFLLNDTFKIHSLLKIPPPTLENIEHGNLG